MTGVKWSKLRFQWKSALNACPEVARSAKHFGSYLCDTCVNRNNGQFYHRNRTMAKALGVSPRSIQRYLAELQERGWLRACPEGARRRTFLLAFPNGMEAFNGRLDQATGATDLTPHADKPVTPYKNQVDNQSESVRDASVQRFVIVGENEQSCLLDWKGYLQREGYDAERLLSRLKSGNWFCSDLVDT